MIKKVIIAVVAILIFATLAYHQGWLSRKGKRAYDKTKEAIVEKGKDAIEKSKDIIDK
ncbi:MAG: hypothetical protein PVI06_15960 [Desulfobacterales bacterium]|jgi:hypothetical protein